MDNKNGGNGLEAATAEFVSYSPLTDLIEAVATNAARVTITIDITPVDPSYKETTERSYKAQPDGE